VVSIPLGLWAGMKPESIGGRLIMTGSILGFSLPAFWFGLMLILVFAVFLGWLPASGRGATREIFGIPLSVLTLDGWRHLVLPALTLSLFKMALVLRLVRVSTREALLTDYVKFARAKGLRTRRIIGVHVLKNILIPVVTVMGIEFGHLLTFAVVTESIYAWPGMGKLLIEAIYHLDRPVVVAYLLVTVTIVITLNLLVDLLYAALDPRVKLEAQAS
jgi:peptide/nickel transport system permease protein